MYRFPEIYDMSYDGSFPDEIKFYDAMLRREVGVGASVLELAAGTGRVAIPLADRGFRVTALDHEEAALNYLRRRASKVRTVRGDFTALEFKEKFDAVVFLLGMVCTMWRSDEFPRFLRSLATVLRPGGIALLVLVASDAPSRWLPHAGSWDAVRGTRRTRSWFRAWHDPKLDSDPCVARYEYLILGRDSDGVLRLLEDTGSLRVMTTSHLRDMVGLVPDLALAAWHQGFDFKPSAGAGCVGSAVVVLRRLG